MDTPRKWQVASLATAVASMGIGGMMLARPSNEAVASIELDPITDRSELNLASPGSAPSILDDSPDALRRQIVPPEAIEGPARPSAPPVTSVDSPDTTEGTTNDQTEPSQPAPTSPPPPDNPSSPDGPASVDSSSSIDS